MAVGSADITARLVAPDVVGDVVRSRAIQVVYAGIGLAPVDSLTGLGQTRTIIARGLDLDGQPHGIVPALFSTDDSTVIQSVIRASSQP